jgi:hypothetical protein
MSVTKTEFRYGWIAAALLAFLILGGCGTSKAIKYSYITRTSFQELKSYQWGKADSLYRQDPILEANVQFLTDRDLEKMGLIKKAEKAELLIWISYEYSYSDFNDKLRTMSLSISRADNNELVWRGTAVGDIRTDANASELKKVLEIILANFPSK